MTKATHDREIEIFRWGQKWRDYALSLERQLAEAQAQNADLTRRLGNEFHRGVEAAATWAWEQCGPNVGEAIRALAPEGTPE